MTSPGSLSLLLSWCRISWYLAIQSEISRPAYRAHITYELFGKQHLCPHSKLSLGQSVHLSAPWVTYPYFKVPEVPLAKLESVSWYSARDDAVLKLSLLVASLAECWHNCIPTDQQENNPQAHSSQLTSRGVWSEIVLPIHRLHRKQTNASKQLKVILIEQQESKLAGDTGQLELAPWWQCC